MGVVLLILKILGITLLCILGLVLLILALVLFVPIRYRVKGSVRSKTEHEGTVLVSWLLRALTIRVIDDPETKTISKRIRILGLFGRKWDEVIFPKKKEEDEEDEEPEEDAAGSTSQSVSESTSAGSTAGSSESSSGNTSVSHAESPAETSSATVSQAATDSAVSTVEVTSESTSAGKPENSSESISGSSGSADSGSIESGGETAETEEKPKKRSIGERIEDMKETASCVLELFSRRKDLLKTYFTKKSTKAAVAKLWKTVKWLLKTIAPRKGHAEVTFGLKDPEMTGKAFAAAASLYPWYGGHIDVYPEFSGEKLEGEGDVRGRLRLWGVVIRGLSILFDKNIKKVRREFKTVKETMMGTPAEVKKIIKKENAA